MKSDGTLAENSAMSRVGAEALAGRVAGFVAHLRLNDFALGPAESAAALALLGDIDGCDPREVRLGLKSLLAGRREEWERFDDLFEAYWQGRGRVRRSAAAVATDPRSRTPPGPWRNHLAPPAPSGRAERARPPGLHGADGDAPRGTGRVVASPRSTLARTDLRHLADPAELAEAERLAARLARAMRHRISRRYRNAPRAPRLDLRRTLRRNLGRGGDPIDLVRRRRRDRPVRIVVLLDVSGSMEQYSRFFLQFVKGLVGAWVESDAYLFHTRLVRVTEAMRDHDPVRAMSRLALLAQGFGGGTRIAGSLAAFNDRYAKAALDSRSVVMILSDGYDTGDASAMAREMRRLRRRARRLVWLNPLLGWRGYEPVARAMAAALPFVDSFAPAHTSKPSRPSRASWPACRRAGVGRPGGRAPAGRAPARARSGRWPLDTEISPAFRCVERRAQLPFALARFRADRETKRRR